MDSSGGGCGAALLKGCLVSWSLDLKWRNSDAQEMVEERFGKKCADSESGDGRGGELWSNRIG